jgi:NitT/TauT family transport system permease protein
MRVGLLLWYGGAWLLNAPGAIERVLRDQPWAWPDLLAATMAMERPVLPAPHQIATNFYETVFTLPPSSKRSLVFHAGVTVSATLLGFLFGALLGMLLAIAIVHLPVLDRSLQLRCSDSRR